MGLETGTYISDLVAANPLGSDGKDKGDDHIRFIKSTLKATYPNVTGAVTPTHTELNYSVGVTSAIQTQFGAKGAISGQTWTGTHAFAGATAVTVPTKSALDNSTNASSTAYVDTAVTVAAVNAAVALTATSTTSLAISIGSKSLTIQTGKAFLANTHFVSLVSNANSANFMAGMVTASNSATGALTVNVTATGGSGTLADWNISLSGNPGATGVAAATTTQTLTDAATVAWDWSAGRIATVTLGGNRIIGLPTNLVTDTFIFKVIQDGTGSRTLTWNAIFKWGAGTAPVLSTVAGRVDLFTGYYDGTVIHANMFSQGSR